MWRPTGGLCCNNQCAGAAMKSHDSEDACGACLARGRRVAPLDTTREVLLLWAASGQTVDREWVARLVVCWECRAAVERTVKFCRRVRTAQALLASAQPSASDDVEQLTCLSTLGSRTKIGFDYECCHNGDTDTDLPGSLTDEDHDSDTGHKKSIWEIDLCPIVNLQEDKYSTNIPVLEEGSFLVMNDMTNKKQRSTVEKHVNVPDTVTVRMINGSIVKRVELSELTVKKEGEMELPEVRLKKEKMELSDLTIVNAEGKELSDIVVKKLEKRDFSEVAIKKIEKKKPIDRAKRKIETRKPFDRTIKEIKSTEAPDLTIVNAVELSDVTIKKAKTKSKKIQKTKRDVEESAEMESSVPIILTEATYIPSQRPGKISTVLMSESEMQATREADRRAEPYVRSPFKCETCVLGFASRALLEEHDRGKHAPELGDYTCDVCASRLASAPQLAGHRRAHYAAHACGACGHAERRLAAARRHAAAHAPERTYACRHCGQQFRKLRQVRYHRETKHRARRECPLCRKTYSTRTALIQHLKIHSGLPLCECAHCGKSYRGKGALVAHMRTHAPAASENAYCAECDAQFKNEFIYRAHLKSSRRHVRKEDLKYQCDACDKSFVHPGGLRHHYDYAHLRAATYKCDACDKIFVNMRGLKRHTRTLHEGVRPAKNKICGVCGKAFLNKKDLIQHQDIHTGARPYSCDICASTFRQSSALYTHRRLVHLKIKRNKGTVEA